MSHKLASTFTSFIYNQARRVLVEDDLGNFDLRLIQPNGLIDERCRRIKNNVPGAVVTGQASEIEPAPFEFHVEITERLSDTVSMVYQGTALVDSRGDVTSIAGFRKRVTSGPAIAGRDLAPQDETTWVVTKP